MVEQRQIIGKFLDPKAAIAFKKIFGQHPDMGISVENVRDLTGLPLEFIQSLRS